MPEQISKDKVGKIHLLKSEGLTTSEISKELNISRGTVRNYLNPSYLKKNNEVERQVRELKVISQFNKVMQLMRVAG
jgi:orotate phosphoribosyltransferase-like protein